MRPSLCVILASSAFAHAGPLEPALIEREARWIVHMDVEAGMSSRVGEVVRNLAAKGELPGRDELAAKLGFDPMTTMLGMTFYGRSYDQDDGVAILTTTVEVEQAVARLATSGLEGYATESFEGTQIHHWTQDGQEFHGVVIAGAVPSQRRVVLSGTRERLTQALRVIRAESPSRADDASRLNAEGTTVYVSAREIAANAIPAKAATFRGLDAVTLRMGQRPDASGQDEMYAEADLTATTPRRAQQAHDMLKGLLSTAEMMSEDNPELKPLGDLVARVSVELEGSIVKVRATHSAADAAATLREAFAARRLFQTPAQPTSQEKPHGVE
ncbi:MAG: hypothetical protein HBSAPP03_01490 [Phycisphaerae bacterium]|nr:MAG: hypothetical protein HBSAPP03_01490 [Phycisphaerae bacterium]